MNLFSKGAKLEGGKVCARRIHFIGTSSPTYIPWRNTGSVYCIRTAEGVLYTLSCPLLEILRCISHLLCSTFFSLSMEKKRLDITLRGFMSLIIIMYERTALIRKSCRLTFCWVLNFYNDNRSFFTRIQA